MHVCVGKCIGKDRETNRKIHEDLQFNFFQILTEGFTSFPEPVKLLSELLQLKAFNRLDSSTDMLVKTESQVVVPTGKAGRGQARKRRKCTQHRVACT